MFGKQLIRGRCMRKGFSLVEIMVVVVILGILAGVGVPKLFGVIAKARASEVPVAAGTYVSRLWNLDNLLIVSTICTGTLIVLA